MVDIQLKPTDCLETVLPTIELAMGSGEICRIRNIDYLGRLEESALALLTASDSLLDSSTGKIFRTHPGFGLIVVDESGHTRTLV